MTSSRLLKVCLSITTYTIFCFLIPHGFASQGTNFAELCFKCHPEAKELVNAKVLHKPVSKGACTACHNPHVSRHAGLLNDTGEKLCYKCHEKNDGFVGEVVHEPLKKGQCLQCHAPHSSDNSGLLRQSLSEDRKSVV